MFVLTDSVGCGVVGGMGRIGVRKVPGGGHLDVVDVEGLAVFRFRRTPAFAVNETQHELKPEYVWQNTLKKVQHPDVL